eukprot:10638583-Alexandrium_andersonii.AAC.1
MRREGRWYGPKQAPFSEWIAVFRHPLIFQGAPRAPSLTRRRLGGRSASEVRPRLWGSVA